MTVEIVDFLCKIPSSGEQDALNLIHCCKKEMVRIKAKF